MLRRSRLYLLITLLVLLRDVLSEVAKISMSQIFRKATSFAWACYHVMFKIGHLPEKNKREAPLVKKFPENQVFLFSGHLTFPRYMGGGTGFFLGGPRSSDFKEDPPWLGPTGKILKFWYFRMAKIQS